MIDLVDKQNLYPHNSISLSSKRDWDYSFCKENCKKIKFGCRRSLSL